jgi:hypothetical protein
MEINGPSKCDCLMRLLMEKPARGHELREFLFNPIASKEGNTDPIKSTAGFKPSTGRSALGERRVRLRFHFPSKFPSYQLSMRYTTRQIRVSSFPSDFCADNG